MRGKDQAASLPRNAAHARFVSAEGREMGDAAVCLQYKRIKTSPQV